MTSRLKSYSGSSGISDNTEEKVNVMVWLEWASLERMKRINDTAAQTSNTKHRFFKTASVHIIQFMSMRNVDFRHELISWR